MNIGEIWSRNNSRAIPNKDRTEGKFYRKKKSYMHDYSVPESKWL